MKIGFTGDIAFSEYTKDLYKHPKVLNKKIYDFLNNNDYNVLNFESPITESNLTQKSALAHKSSFEALDYIKEYIKNPVLSLANNHMMDFGQRGLLDTMKYVKSEKLPFIGAGKNEEDATKYIILGKDVKVGIIAVQYKDYLIATADTPGTAQNNHFKLIKKKILELKNKVDWVVMIYHGGEEFINTPLPYTRSLYKKFLKWGADIVVAHHPHTVQGYEKVGNKIIFYSLGNFIFDTDFQRAQEGTDEGVLISIDFNKDSYSFDKLLLKKDRENNKLETIEDNINFCDIKKKYYKNWRKEARRLKDIKERRVELKKYRNRFLLSNLYIEKAQIDNICSFDDIVKKNYGEDLDLKPEFIHTNRFVRKFRKLKKVNYKKHFYIKLASIFR